MYNGCLSHAPVAKSFGKNTSVCSFDALFDLIKHGIESIVIKVESEKKHTVKAYT